MTDVRRRLAVVTRPSIERQALDHGVVAELLAQPVDRVLGLARCAGRADRRGRRRRRRRARETPMPIRRNLVPSVSRASRSRPAAKIRAASWVGWPSERARVRMRKSAVLSLSVTVEPASSLLLQAGGDLLGQPPQPRSSGRNSAMSCSKVVSAEMLLASRSGLTDAVVDAAGEPRTAARPRRRSGASGRASLGALQVADRAEAVAREPLLRHLADAEDERHRLVGARKAAASRAAEHRKAARLVEVGGDLGEELVARRARSRR